MVCTLRDPSPCCCPLPSFSNQSPASAIGWLAWIKDLHVISCVRGIFWWQTTLGCSQEESDNLDEHAKEGTKYRVN
eukprot:5541933-Amphidinium_carterae.1